MLGEPLEIVEQDRHGRVEAVLFLQLQRQALGQIPRHHTSWLEGLRRRQDGLDPGALQTQPVGDLVEVGAQIAIFISEVDQVCPDQAVDRI